MKTTALAVAALGLYTLICLASIVGVTYSQRMQMKRLVDASLRGGSPGAKIAEDVAFQPPEVGKTTKTTGKNEEEAVDPCLDYSAEESNVLCMHVSKTESGPTRDKRCNKRITMSDDKKMHTFVKYICHKTCGLCDGLADSPDLQGRKKLLEEQLRQTEKQNKALESTNNELKSRLNGSDDKKFAELVHKQQEELQRGGELYLTFDDGPLDSTLDVLDVLSELNVKATFFINGVHIFGDTEENENENENNEHGGHEHDAEASLQAFKRLIDDEHVIANHSFDHMSHNLPLNGFKDVQDDVGFFYDNTKQLRDLIKENTGLSHVLTNDKLDSIARLPYTNVFRVGNLKSDCQCCTLDDPNSDCSPENPSNTGTQSVLLADKLKSDGTEVYGWDIEWGPTSWEDENPADSLVSGGEFAKQVVEASKIDQCKRLQYSEVTSCDPDENQGKVVILTHDNLFGGGSRNLPELRQFIRLMKYQGFVFKTLDQYGSRQDIKAKTK